MTYKEFQERYQEVEELYCRNDKDNNIIVRVFKALDTQKNIFVVVKIPEYQVQNEARVFLEKKKAHQYIAKYLDFGSFVDEDGKRKEYIVMQYYNDGDLRKLISENSFLSEKEKEDFLIHVLEGIKFLHTLPEDKIQHRDLKPENILIDIDNGEKIPKICDFGFSKIKNSSDDLTTNLGPYTPQYASPEQIKLLPKLPDNTDLWSFGVIAFETFTGKLPFGNRWEEGKEIPDEINDVPERWQKLIRCCLVPDFSKGNRVQNTDECFDILNGEEKVESVEEPELVDVVNDNSDNNVEKRKNMQSSEKPKKSKWKNIFTWLWRVALITVLLGILAGLITAILTDTPVFKQFKKFLIGTEQTVNDSIKTEDNISLPGNIQDTTSLQTGEKADNKTKGQQNPLVSKETGNDKTEKTQVKEVEQKPVIEEKNNIPVQEKQAEFLKQFNLQMVKVGDFEIGKYEVTQKQWELVMDNNPVKLFRGDNYPVQNVNWNNVQEFIKKLNEKTGKNYRLPTGREWKDAARGGSKSKGYKYSGSDDIDEVAWYEDKPRPVGSLNPNELGIYDMSGNVGEWCSDQRIYGGSWFENDTTKCLVDSPPEDKGTIYKGSEVGFRLARTLD
ncbi:MAG: bifunctional serine/threonine-protein kinase/formylglycine-generating enzyme family protein [Candidatus Azobacteroides sp.]|nr:bifunctional serine/threonine-protein kinase/formylglycine-generating enzyme family protein [Candidatus Azobacteroides sp.]